MPRFFFNVHDGQDYPDLDGTELASIPDARRHASKYAGELLKADPDVFWNDQRWQMDVTDDRGLILYQLMFVGVNAPAAG